MGISQIRKRDGRIVDFDASKIEVAIHKALAATNCKNGEVAKSLAAQVVAALEKNYRMPHVENVQDTVEEVLIKNNYAKTAKAYILYRQERTKVREAKKFLGVSDELKLGVNAVRVLERRYLLRDEKGSIVETPAQLFRRVAKATASVDLLHKTVKTEEEFYNMLANLEFLPNSPTLMNAGTELGQLSACFVLPVEDSVKSIFEALTSMALIHQSGGGTGFSFSKLRPKGDIVKSTKGVASGPVSFMRIFDVATEVIKQGGRRRGANMGILRIDHPDVAEFITAKEKEGFLANFNISVGITDAFMSAVEKNEDWELINPRTGKPEKKFKARDIFDLIVTMAWRTGDPGLIFLDEINRHNPTPHLGEIESTNPCITGDTLVATHNGLIPINKLHNPNKVLAKDGNYYPIPWVKKTGRKEVFRVKTKAGYEVKATAEHKFLTDDGWKPLKDLTKKAKLVLQQNGSFGNLHIEKELALILGWLIGDGCITKNFEDAIFYFNKDDKIEILPIFKQYLDRINGKEVKVQINGSEIRLKYSSKIAKIFRSLGATYRKEVPESVFQMDRESIKNFLSALFAADGSVQGNRKKGVSVRLSSSSLKLLKQVQLLLLQFGIFSRMHENRRRARWKELPDSQRKPKKYFCKAQHELIISRKSMFKFMEKIGFCISSKKLKFEKIKPSKIYRDNIDSSVEKIEKVGIEDVYDLSEPITHSFIANGIVVHNCGEVPLLPYESCNLGSINLSKMVRNGEIDWEKLRSITRTAVRFLDNVIDANKYPLPEIEKATKANRKIGLGVMGFADMLLKLRIPYDSNEALATAEKVMKFISEEAKKKSMEIAQERGSFPNATVTSVAPTGTISIIAGVSSGIEPLFAISFVRNVMGTQLLEVNPIFESVARERNFYSTDLMIEIAKKGSIQSIKEIPEDVRRIFVTALDIAPEWHVKMQAAFQKYVDNAVAKTVNLPHSAAMEDVRKIFLMAYKLKCKGTTVYRYGSKSEQVLYVGLDDKRGVIASSEYAGGCPSGVCPL